MAHGPSGVGKTFVVLDWALSIAYLDQWAGKNITNEGGAVAYLAGEGHYGIRGRVAAWKQNAPVGCFRAVLSFARSVRLEYTARPSSSYFEIRRMPEPPALVVVDTLHRFMAGDENSAQDAKTMIDACAVIQKSLIARFFWYTIPEFPTRPKHVRADRLHGAGALENEISIRPDSGGLCITQEKIKDAEKEAPLYFTLESVPIVGWTDEDGEQVTSAVVSFTEKTEKRRQKKRGRRGPDRRNVELFRARRTRRVSVFNLLGDEKISD